MIKREADFNKLMTVRALNKGDKVKLHDGQIAEFVRCKQKKFIGIINGQSWDIWIDSFVEVVEEAKVEIKTASSIDLKKGEPFFIEKSGKAILYIFEKMEKGRIIGTNPVSKGRTQIDVSLYSGKVSEL